MCWSHPMEFILSSDARLLMLHRYIDGIIQQPQLTVSAQGEKYYTGVVEDFNHLISFHILSNSHNIAHIIAS